MNFFPDSAWQRRSGFTLVELLVVLVILGVLTTMVVLPTFSTGSDMTRIRTATRGVMQMSRYARTMAVLYQTPILLTISSDGTLRVDRASGETTSSAATAEETAKTEAVPAEGASSGEAEATASPDGGGGASYVMADVNAEKKYPQVVFSSRLDADAMSEDETAEASKTDEDGPDDGEEVRSVRIPYESNGRCLPYTVKIRAAGTETADGADVVTVTVDRFGVAKVLDEDE